ncbi:unnamed protein product [Effrenium voratum]|nr:unnamed protein product [Effrenium voratum]
MKVPFFCALVEMACREEPHPKFESISEGEGITKTVHDLAQANSGAFAMKAEVELLQVQPLEGRALRANFKAPQATKVLAKSLAFDGVQDLAKRYVARLGLAAQVVAPAMHIANQALQHDFVKQGKGLLEHSLAAAAMASAIFIVAWLLDAEIKPRLADVATVVKVSEGSVQTAYRQMREQIRKLLPKGFVIQHKLGVEGLPKLEEKTRKRSADLM